MHFTLIMVKYFVKIMAGTFSLQLSYDLALNSVNLYDLQSTRKGKDIVNYLSVLRAIRYSHLICFPEEKN